MSRADTQKAVIFLHIPKAAGSTLHDIIERQYHPKAVFSITGNQVDKSIEEFRQLPELKRRQLKMIKGHLGFGLHEFLPQGADYFTLLRHPVDRILSHYYYVVRRPSHYLYNAVVDNNMSLKDFARSGISYELDNGQARLLAGQQGQADLNIEIGQCSNTLLETAKQNLRNYFPVVGTTENFDRMLMLLKKNFNWKNILYVKKRVTQNRPKPKQIDPDTRKIIETYNEIDLNLYQYAKQLLEEQISVQDSSFFEELKQFQDLNNSFYGKLNAQFYYGFYKVRNKALLIV